LLSVSGVSNDVFLKSPSIKMLPLVSAEWNQNIFNAPYLTVAGVGTPVDISTVSNDITAVTDSNKHPHFDTFSFQMTGSNDKIEYTSTPSLPAQAFKIITYVTTNSSTAIMVNAYAKGTSSRQFGSHNIEANSYNWTKLETYIGAEQNISEFAFNITFNKFSTKT